MFTPTRTVLAMLCAAPLLGACNTTAIQQIAGTLTAGTITLGQLTPAILDAAGVSTSDKDKANAILAQIVNTAKLSCGLAPTATSILNIVAALNPTATAVAVPINTVVNVACEALTAPSAQVVSTTKAARTRVAASVPVVQTVRGQIKVNGVVVTVTGFTDPAYAAAQ
jgi:hypothetical protein